MYRRLISLAATLALSVMLGGNALADPPVVGASVQPDQSHPATSGGATVPMDTSTPIANLISSEPITASTGTGTDGFASSSGTSVSGPGTRVSAPAYSTRGSGAPSASSLSTEPPTESHHASAPTDTSGTAVGPSDQTIALRSSDTGAGGSVSDPSSAGATAAFCFLAHANESTGTPTASVSSVCGDSPSATNVSGSSDQGGATTGNAGLGGSLCLVGNAQGNTPPTASVDTTCAGPNVSTASGENAASASDGSSIAPAVRASLQAADNAWTGLATLPYTGTASAPLLGGLALIGAGFAILFRTRKTS